MTAGTDETARSLQLEGQAHAAAGRLEAAGAAFEAAIALQPTVRLWCELAAVRLMQGDRDGGEAAYRAALAVEPGNAQVLGFLGLSVLHRRRWAEGFSLYDNWRRIEPPPTPPAPDLGLPVWSGEPLAGRRALIWGEEGFGDQIMFARFAPLLVEAGAEVGWVVREPLVRLIREGLGQSAVPHAKGVTIEGADLMIPSSRLPVVFMQTLPAPPAEPYLKPPKALRAPGLTIGVVGRGNPHHDNDRWRSLTPEAEAALMALPGAVSLKPEDTGARDFWDTAGIIMGLDLVISVDTSVVHLAGALGRPCWVLLPTRCDWRWGERGETSPWYPSVRLFRQRVAGEWSSVLDEVREALAGL